MAPVGQGLPPAESALVQRAHRAGAELNLTPAAAVMIGSQVSYGSVGLSAALPVTLAAGVRVLPVPTVLLSSMPHYANSHRAVLDPDWLAQTLTDLEALGLLREISTIATGYFASAAQIEVVADWIRGIRVRHPQIRVIVDPTFGDTDAGVYTAPEIAVALRGHLIPLATGLLPNAFEFAHLTAGTEDPVAAARGLLGEHGEWLVVTSRQLSDDEVVDLVVTRSEVHRVCSPRVRTEAKGAGDVYAAALLAALHRGMTLVDAATQAARTVHAGLSARAL